MKKNLWLLILLVAVGTRTLAQVTFPYNGIKTTKENYYALTHATIYTDYKTRIDDATLIIRDGNVENVGINIPIPAGAVVKDMSGYTIYPAFIDLYSNYGIKTPELPKKTNPGPQIASMKPGAYNWNQAIHPEINAADNFVKDEKLAEKYRKMGFGITLSESEDGIMRGTGALLLTGTEAENLMIVRPTASACYSFYKGSSPQDYPSSLMGSIALLRQNFYDAKWYANGGNKEEQNISLDALNKQLSLPQIFDARDVLNILRADKIAKEFNSVFIIKGAGNEYQRADEIKKTGCAIIIPINFPLAYDVSDAGDAQLIPLHNLQHWELAPFNPRILFEKGITYSITGDGIDNADDFVKNLRLAVKKGLPQEEALKALTITPATLLKIDDVAGSLQKGKLANFVVTQGALFDSTSKIINTWVKGKEYFVNTPKPRVASLTYKLTVGNEKYDLLVDATSGTVGATLKTDSGKIPVVVVYNEPAVSFSFIIKKNRKQTEYFLEGYKVESGFKGTASFDGMKEVPWHADLPDTAAMLKKPVPTVVKQINIPPIPYPFGPYGWDTLPKAHDVLIKNATVWTNEKEGIALNTDVLIHDGKIAKVEKGIAAGKAEIIDATGLDVTSGIIDEHSHIAISDGVNEGGASATSEVRIGDVVNSEDINIYRQLAGGVTCSHLLHGSANAIGGQTQLVKLRWGYAPEDMKFAGWPGFIKFALGENVKQSNWGDLQSVRFPQSRMGVEEWYYYMFGQAKEYDAKWKQYNGLSAKLKTGTIAPRKDLRLDALAEIINKKRFITCHSYQQGEINMLMHVADSFKFTLNTFTHILEGYKVADKMLKHGANASTFSDWWAYKFEVIDAIPYNGALMHKVGLNVSYNSDDPEMARRLNQEAAKAVMYGGVSEEDAWKFVTLNPAKMLHVDDKVGSLKVGKDADVVIWSGNPLSMYSKCERTYVDGICFFSMDRDMEQRGFIIKERNRLLQLMSEAKKNGAPTQPFKIQFNELYTCDTMGDFVK